MKKKALYTLIVDDDQFVRSILKTALEKLPGINLLEAKNGHEAITLLEKHGSEICLIITDHDMPGMSGSEIIAWTKDRFPKIKSLLISGGLSQRDIDKMKGRFEPNFFLAKPFCISVIIALALDLITEFMLGNKHHRGNGN